MLSICKWQLSFTWPRQELLPYWKGHDFIWVVMGSSTLRKTLQSWLLYLKQSHGGQGRLKGLHGYMFCVKNVYSKPASPGPAFGSRWRAHASGSNLQETTPKTQLLYSNHQKSHSLPLCLPVASMLCCRSSCHSRPLRNGSSFSQTVASYQKEKEGGKGVDIDWGRQHASCFI